MKIEKFRPLRQAPTPQEMDQKLKDVAKLYENQFLREMVKSMRSTVTDSGFIKKNQAEQIFSEKLDQQYVDNWSDKGGVGFADMIYKQLIEKYGPAMGIRPPPARPQGPLPIDVKSQFTGHIKVDPQNQNKMQVEYKREAEGVETLQSPWSGMFKRHYQFAPDEHMVELLHDNGISSKIAFRGQVLPGAMGQEIQAGSSLAVLSPETKAFYWNLDLSEFSKTE